MNNDDTACYAYKDQGAAEEAVGKWRGDYQLAINELRELNRRLDSKSLDEYIAVMESRLRRY